MSRYECLKCDGALFARQGAVMEHHFYHKKITDCTGTGETPEHRIAKNRLQAFLRQNVRVRVANCHSICNKNCFTDIVRRPHETVKVEYRLPNGDGIADVAVIDQRTNEARVLFEVYNTHKTDSIRAEPWFEVDYSEILDKTNYFDAVLHLNEQRDIIPHSRHCLAHTFQQQVWLAGYHQASLSLSDTLDKEILNLWDYTRIQADEFPMLPDDYKNKLRSNQCTKKEKIRLYSNHFPHAYLYEELDEQNNAKAWGRIRIDNYDSTIRAQKFVKTSRKCISCHRHLSSQLDDWKILCRGCWSERAKESNR